MIYLAQVSDLIIGSVTLPCRSGSVLTYAWSRESLEGPAVALDLPSSTSSTLSVPKFTFAPNTNVTLQLVVAVDGDLDTLGSDYVIHFLWNSSHIM